MDKKRSEKKPEKRRNEKEGIFNFTKEMVSALIMAFVAIVYIIQAFKIPTGSMEDSLLVGDFLLGLKFIYGAPVLPFSYKKFPGIVSPKQGDVVIFKYPGADKKDYIKRCVAGPGQTIEFNKDIIIVDNDTLIIPPKGKYKNSGVLYNRYTGEEAYRITRFKPLRIPAKRDTLYPGRMDVREFLFLKHLIKQENPREKVTSKFQLYIDGEFANSQPFPTRMTHGRLVSLNQINFEKIDNWTELDLLFDDAKEIDTSKNTEVRMFLFLNGKQIDKYIVKYDNYFMVGDNRDNSMDSRYWGYVNRNFVKAKAFILYFSLDKDTPYFLLPLKIRWNRIGKLIRNWDGLEKN